MPLSIGFVLFIIGLFYLYTHSYKKAKFYLSISFIWVFLIAYAPFSNMLLEPLESQYPKIDLEKQQAKYILLLGGYFNDRGYEAIRLHHKINDSKIITSGYPGSYKTISEAEVNANKLIELGIKKENILMQSEPRDTQEEARHIKKIVGNENFILVTSAYHMPRAMRAFKQEGLDPIPAPANFFVKSKASLISLPSGGNIRKTEIAQHEYLGMLWYKVKTFFE